MPFIVMPRDIPERVFRGHNAEGETLQDLQNRAYADGYKDAVRMLLGADSAFALLCMLDGNPLPTLTIVPKARELDGGA